MPTLTDMPIVALNKTVDDSDLTAILSLRKVCQFLRTYLIDTKPDLKLTGIELTLSKKEMIMELAYPGGVEIVEYKYHGFWACLVTNGHGEDKIIQKASMVDAFFGDLNVIMEHQHSVLNTFELTPKIPDESLEDDYESKDFENHEIEFRPFLKLKGSFLKTKECTLEVSTEQQMMSILPYLDPQHLKRFTLEIWNSRFEINKRTLKTFKMEELEQWKNLETVNIRKVLTIRSIRNFSHFHKADLSFGKLTMSDFVYLKETYLRFPNFREMSLSCKIFPDNTKFLSSFGEWFDHEESPGRHRHYWWFRFENSEDVLEISRSADPDYFVFKRIPATNVKKNGIVHEFLN